MDLSWFPYSIAATVFLGVSMVFYKMPSFRNYSPFLSTFYANGLTAILACVLLYFQTGFANFSISILGIVWGILFAGTMILQKVTLKTLETNALFPVTTSVSNVITILIGIIFLSERLSLVQVVGVAAIILSAYLFTRKKEDFPLNPLVLMLAAGIIVSSTLSKYVQKTGASNESIFNFMVWSFIGASAAALLGAFIFEKDTQKELASSKKYLLASCLIGIFGFLGSWAILKALSLGPLSAIYAIHPSYVLITAIMGALIFGENLTKRKILLILLTIIGVILIKIG